MSCMYYALYTIYRNKAEFTLINKEKLINCCFFERGKVMFAIQYADPRHTEIRDLLIESHKLMQLLYANHQDHSFSINELCENSVRFLGAKTEKTFVGCAALKLHEGYGEIKSLFAASNHRGKGVGKALLSALEREAVKLHLPCLKLKTGALLREATGLYVKAGFQFCGPFGQYEDDGVSLFMNKSLF